MLGHSATACITHSRAAELNEAFFSDILEVLAALGPDAPALIIWETSISIRQTALFLLMLSPKVSFWIWVKIVVQHFYHPMVNHED